MKEGQLLLAVKSSRNLLTGISLGPPCCVYRLSLFSSTVARMSGLASTLNRYFGFVGKEVQEVGARLSLGASALNREIV
eukprot:1192311-Prorocentrum_minimum.AAC.2